MVETSPRSGWEALRRLARSYPELLAVLGAATVGLSLRSPARWLIDHRGIDVLLVVLVTTTALASDASGARAALTQRRRVGGALVAGAVVLPLLAWLVARLVHAGALRDGVTTIGLAPCEIASVTTVGLAGGTTSVALAILLGSTLLTVGTIGPALALEGGGTRYGSGSLVVELATVVLVPLVAGLLLRSRCDVDRHRRALSRTTIGALSMLVALIASEAKVSMDYLPVAAAIVIFTLAAAAVGAVLARGAPVNVTAALVLTTSMRDFAIAAGIASAAFGPQATAPLGLYGIVVMVWGTGLAGALRRRSP